jgi:glycosyltransferase involved in cell wall biosynthesis
MTTSAASNSFTSRSFPSRVVLFANTDWYLYNFRLKLALKLSELGSDVLLISPPGPYAERFASCGLRWKAFPFERRSLNPLAQAKAVARLARIYAEERPSVVHHFTIKCAVYGSIAARLTRVPVVVNAVTGLGSAVGYNGDAPSVARALALTSLKLALRNTRVVVQNPDDRAQLERMNIVDPSQCTLIRSSGVDTARFCPVPKKGPGITLLLASRLLWSKGIQEYVEAAQAIRSRHPRVRFLIAGEADPGNPDTLHAQDVERLKSNPDIEYIGHCDDIAAQLTRTDIAVLPSYGEGLPRSLTEAAAAGLPLIATDVPGCREVVRPGVNGILVNPRDVRSLVEAIESLVLDPNLRSSMGSRSRLIAEHEFAESIVIDATIRAYGSPTRSRESAVSQPVMSRSINS